MQNDRLDYLFLRYYKKTATPAEREELMEVLRANENNEQIQQLISKAIREEDYSHQLSKEVADDILSSIFGATSEASKRLVPQIGQDVFVTKQTTIFRSFSAWASTVAAACLIGIMCFAGYRWYEGKFIQKDNALATIEAAKELLPGKDKAQLTLGDGRILELDAVSSGQLLRASGIEINTSKGELIYTKNAEKVEYNTLITPLGGQYKVVLPDGSRAWLNAGSSLRFPTTFSGTKRQVEMSGEVYFEVHPDKRRPFTVQLAEKKVNGENLEINVLGTHFNVSSYSDELTIRTTLLEGSVELTQGNASKIITPGQQAQVLRGKEKPEIQVRNVDAESMVAWKEGRFEFNGNLKDIMRQIARWYNVEVQFDGDVGNKSYIGAISRKNNVAEVLKMLELTGGIKFTVVDRKIIIKPSN